MILIMKNKIPIAFSLLVMLTITVKNIHAQIYKCTVGSVSFFSEAPIENIDATSKSLNSFINTEAKTIAFIIPINSFVFKKALMQEHFNEKYMESETYPLAKYTGIINETIDFTKEGIYKVTTTGKLTMHGVEKLVTEPGTITIKDNTIKLSSEFMVAVKEYKVEIPTLLFQNIAENILIKLNGVYEPYKK